MALFRRRPVPAQVREVVLPPGERLEAWATTVTGDPVVATGQRLILPGGRELPWSAIERVSWNRPQLLVVESNQVVGAGAHRSLELADEGSAADLPTVVRGRVTASVAWSRHERLEPSGGVRIVGRRQPGSDTLDWQLVFDEGTPVADPRVREQAEQLLLGARRSIG